MANGKKGENGKSRDIPTRTFDFGVRIIRLGRFLYRQTDVPRRLTDQLVGCGTSIGANVEEGQAAQSRRDFISKYGIALKEARESAFRLKLFMASDVLTKRQGDALHAEAEELKSMIAQAIVAARRNLDKDTQGTEDDGNPNVA